MVPKLEFVDGRFDDNGALNVLGHTWYDCLAERTQILALWPETPPVASPPSCPGVPSTDGPGAQPSTPPPPSSAGTAGSPAVPRDDLALVAAYIAARDQSGLESTQRDCVRRTGLTRYAVRKVWPPDRVPKRGRRKVKLPEI